MNPERPGLGNQQDDGVVGEMFGGEIGCRGDVDPPGPEIIFVQEARNRRKPVEIEPGEENGRVPGEYGDQQPDECRPGHPADPGSERRRHRAGEGGGGDENGEEKTTVLDEKTPAEQADDRCRPQRRPEAPVRSSDQCGAEEKEQPLWSEQTALPSRVNGPEGQSPDLCRRPQEG